VGRDRQLQCFRQEPDSLDAVTASPDEFVRKAGHVGIVDFLKTETPKADLATTLRVLREFKECESQEEWFMINFEAWAKLEQLEEFLDHLVNDADLKDDTKHVLAKASS
jgi:hypothetical protein